MSTARYNLASVKPLLVPNMTINKINKPLVFDFPELYELDV